ncbi:MAG: hypothetical protein Q9170_004932 [Blastenia crenularia]
MARSALVVGIIRLDNHEFEIGTAPTIFATKYRLHQAQVTALISLGLVLIRLVVSSSSVLLTWRIVFILLEKRGITLGELARLTNVRVPILPGKQSRKSLLWSVWAATTIILLLPHGFAAPLASSSISWIPGTTVLPESRSTSVASFGDYADWWVILAGDFRMSAITASVAMTAKDPTYAFHASPIPLQRHFNPSQTIPHGSKIDMTVPYFTVNLRWVDASSNWRSRSAGDSGAQDVNENTFNIRSKGAVGIIRDQKWDAQAAIPDAAKIFRGRSVGDELPDGSRANKNSKCPTVSDAFGKLPDVEQYQIEFHSKEVDSYDCYIFAEATITAGSFPAKACTVTTSVGNAEFYATCSTERDDNAVEQHWLTDLALDFTSEVLKYTVRQNYTQPRINHNLDDYTSGLLTLGYHAAWCGLTERLGNDSELAVFRSASPIVLASVDNTKPYIWLAMHATLTVSAILVLFAQCVSKVKTIRDPTVAALTIDLTGIAHSGRADGLCNAVTFSRRYKKSPPCNGQRKERGPGVARSTTRPVGKLYLMKMQWEVLATDVTGINLVVTSHHTRPADRFEVLSPADVLKACKANARYKDSFLLRIDIKRFLKEVDEAEQPISRIHGLVQDARNHRGVDTEITDVPSVLQVRNLLLATVLLFRCDYAILFKFVIHGGGTASGKNLRDFRLSLALNRKDCENLIQESRSRQQPTHEVEGLLY